MQAWSTLVSPEAEADEDFVAVVDADLDVLDQVSDRDDEIPVAAQVLEDSAEGTIEETRARKFARRTKFFARGFHHESDDDEDEEESGSTNPNVRSVEAPSCSQDPTYEVPSQAPKRVRLNR